MTDHIEPRGISEAIYMFSNFDFEIKKTKSAGRYKYADLPEIMDLIKEAMRSCYLTFTSSLCREEGDLLLEGTIEHMPSKETRSIRIPLIYQGSERLNPMQSLGSAMTYARRYAICCLLNLVADEDDDGVASAPLPEQPAKEVHKEFPFQGREFRITEKQAIAIKKLCRGSEEEMNRILKAYSISRIEELPFKECTKVMEELKMRAS